MSLLLLFGGQGVLPPPPPPITAIAPPSESASTSNLLGCGLNRAYVTGQCGGPRICSLENASEISWDRRLDDVSEAHVVIPIGGDPTTACCECLGDVEPWCHELQIVREDEVVWLGPITKVTYGFTEVEIFAKDVAWWLSVRTPEIATPVDPNEVLNLSEIAQQILDVAFAEEDQACILQSVVRSESTLSGSRDYPGLSTDVLANSLDYWLNLAETGLDFTVVNRSIIFGDALLPTMAVSTLTDSLIMGDVRFSKDGNLAANRWFVKWKSGVEQADSAHECYGLIERNKTFEEINDATSAQETAQAYIDATRIVPRILEFPDNTQISPDAPFSIMQLIPGVRFDVALTGLCTEVFASFRLTNMSVTQTGTEDEKVAISLSPVSLGTGTI